MKVNCKHCERYLFEAKETTIITGMICPNSKCKAKMNFKVVFPDATTEQLRYVFDEAEQPPKESKEK